MIGNNELVWCKLQMIRVVQEYLDRALTEKVHVTDVVAVNEAHVESFKVSVTDRAESGETR